VLLLDLLGDSDGVLNVFLRFNDGDNVSLRNTRSTGDLSSGIEGQHNGDLDTQNTLLHQNVANSGVNIRDDRVTSLDHVTIAELHGLGTLGSNFTGNDDLTTTGITLHDESDNTVASTSDSETTQKLVSEGLGLSGSAESAVLNTLGEQVELVGLEVESLLNHGGQLLDAASLLSKNVLSSGGLDDDLGLVGGSSDLNTRVTILSELLREESVQLCVEDTVGNELVLLVDVIICPIIWET